MQPEQKAHHAIDRLLTKAGWHVCDANAVNLSAYRGIAIREFPLKKGNGFADYLLYVDGRAAAGIRRVLFLVDRGNLGDQRLKEADVASPAWSTVSRTKTTKRFARFLGVCSQTGHESPLRVRLVGTIRRS